jgi:hypothetical protein
MFEPLTDTLSPAAVLVMFLLLDLLMSRSLWDEGHPVASCAHEGANSAYRSMHLYSERPEVFPEAGKCVGREKVFDVYASSGVCAPSPK